MHISCFMFLLINCYILFILNVLYTMEMVLDKKQIRAIFLFKFKMGLKAVETTNTINNTFDQELLMNIQSSGGSRSFAKETRNLKMRSAVDSQQKLTAN